MKSLVCSLVFTLLLQTPTSITDTDHHDVAQRVLREAISMGDKIKSQEDRAFFLADACQAAVGIFDKNEAIKTCVRAFAEAKRVRDACNSTKLRVRATVAISKLDPDRAFNLLKTIPFAGCKAEKYDDAR